MNWQEIKSKYPEAYLKCDIWADRNMILDYYEPNMQDIDIRDLYDFFDEHGILLSVHAIECGQGHSWDHVDSSDINDYKFFAMYVNLNYDTFYKSGAVGAKNVEGRAKFDNRVQAEEAGFIQAFKLLEDKLTTKNK